MSIGGTLTGIASRLVDPVERTESPAGHTNIEEILDRQARLIQVLNEQLDLIEQQTGRSPPKVK